MRNILSFDEIRTLLRETSAGTSPRNLSNIYNKLLNAYGDNADYKITKLLDKYKNHIQQTGGDPVLKATAIKNLIDVINALGPAASRNIPQFGDALSTYAQAKALEKSRGLNLGSDNYHNVLELLKKIVPIVNPGMKRELLNILLNYYNLSLSTLTDVQTNALLAVLL